MPGQDACGQKRSAEAEKKPRAPGWEPRPEEDDYSQRDQNQAADDTTAAPPFSRAWLDQCGRVGGRRWRRHLSAWRSRCGTWRRSDRHSASLRGAWVTQQQTQPNQNQDARPEETPAEPGRPAQI